MLKGFFLEGLSYEAIAITDRATLAGCVRAHGAAKQTASAGASGIRLVVGAYVEPVDSMPLVVWAASRVGYSNLCRLLTRCHAAGASRVRDRVTAAVESVDGGRADACLLSLDDVAEHAEGLLAGVPLAAVAKAGMVAAETQREAAEAVLQWREVFDERLVALAEVALEDWEEVVDPAAGEQPASIATIARAADASASGAEPSSVRPSTRASAHPDRTIEASARPPTSRLIASMSIVFPAPVSPVSAVRPPPSTRSSRSITPRDSMWSSWSISGR